MGSAAAAVEISSDEEDSDKMTASGKRKSPEEDALEWAEKILGEDCDAIGEGLDDSAVIQELLESLMDATNVVAGEKESVGDAKSRARDADDGDDDDCVIVVGEKESLGDAKNSVRDADDGDDDDCVILDSDPDKAVAVSKEEGPRRDAAEDELQIVAEKGELACRDFPHPRHLCASLPFSTSSHASHCSMCHCYVCDSPAPCAFWGTGNVRNDHCHATDKDSKWKKLRQSSKNKSQPTPKRRSIQNFFHSSTTEPSSWPSANVTMPSTGRFPVSRIVSQNQHVDPSIMVPRNMVLGICLSRAPSPMPRTTIPSYRSKIAQVAPSVYTPSNVNHLQLSVPSYSLMQPAHPRAFQTAQVPPGDHISAGPFRSYPPQLALSAPIGSQGYQYQPPSYPQLAPNTVVGTGVQLSQCTSLATQGTQYPQAPMANTILKGVLANLKDALGVPDDNINQTLGQQSASTPSQSLHPNQLLAQGKANQWVSVQKSYAAATSQMRLSGGHNSSNHASGGIVHSSGSVQTKQSLNQLNSHSSLTLSDAAPSTYVAPQP